MHMYAHVGLHGCNINGVIMPFIDQEDVHVNVVVDDKGIFAFLFFSSGIANCSELYNFRWKCQMAYQHQRNN